MNYWKRTRDLKVKGEQWMDLLQVMRLQPYIESNILDGTSIS